MNRGSFFKSIAVAIFAPSILIKVAKAVSVIKETKASLFRKNVLNNIIRCGGQPIDMKFMEEMFPKAGEIPKGTWSNHYITDDMDYHRHKGRILTTTPIHRITLTEKNKPCL